MRLCRKSVGDEDGDPRAFFNDILYTLRLPDTDIFVIIDCCFASKAFVNGEMGKRKFELLASTSQTGWALAPKHEVATNRFLRNNLEHTGADNGREVDFNILLLDFIRLQSVPRCYICICIRTVTRFLTHSPAPLPLKYPGPSMSFFSRFPTRSIF